MEVAIAAVEIPGVLVIGTSSLLLKEDSPRKESPTEENSPLVIGVKVREEGSIIEGVEATAGGIKTLLDTTLISSSPIYIYIYIMQ